MKLSFVAFSTVVIGFATAATATVSPWDDAILDVDRKPCILSFDGRTLAKRSGFKYIDSTQKLVETEMMDMKTIVDVDMEVETELQDNTDGSRTVELTMTRMKQSTTTPFGAFHCDSENRQVLDSAFEEEQPDMCDAVLELVGITQTLLIDDEGNILEANGKGAEVARNINDLVSSPGPSDELNGGGQLDFDQVSARSAKMLPKHSVKPGDTWDVEMEMGGAGTTSGTSVLKGYTSYNGIDCAVIVFTGIMKAKLNEISEVFGAADNGDGSCFENTEMAEDGTNDLNMTLTLLWDVNEQLSRWIETNVSMILRQKDPVDGSYVEIPVNETTTVATVIVENA